MKTTTIILGLYGDHRNVQAICGHYKEDFETSQLATYTIEDGLATITDLTPVIKTQVNLPLPFVLPVTDLGSGILKRIDINCDTLSAHLAVCPTQQWADRRALATVPTVAQQLFADHLASL